MYLEWGLSCGRQRTNILVHFDLLIMQQAEHRVTGNTFLVAFSLVCLFIQTESHQALPVLCPFVTWAFASWF